MPRLQRSQRQQKGRKPIQIVAEYELKNVSEELHKEQKDWSRRSEVFNEALAEVIQRGEQRKERSSRVTEAAPAPKLAASTSRELRENSMEPDSNPKKRH